MPEYIDPTKYLGSITNHQKMYDFERDVLRVKNPLNAEFTFIYDQLPHTVPANGTKDMERYLARRFAENMISHLYNQFAEAQVEKFTEAFQRTHPDVIDDPYLINEKIWLKIKRADDPEFQKKVIKDCIVGVVSRFGANRTLPFAPKNTNLDPNTPLFEKLINDFKMVTVDEESQQVDATQPLTQPVSAEEATI